VLSRYAQGCQIEEKTTNDPCIRVVLILTRTTSKSRISFIIIHHLFFILSSPDVQLLYAPLFIVVRTFGVVRLAAVQLLAPVTMPLPS
jgi:hypothetical protein